MKNPGGRPRYQPTNEERERVSELASMGMPHEGIAQVLGIARQTLETYFPVELSMGAYSKRAALLQAAYKAALNGSVAALKLCLAYEIPTACPPLEEEKLEPVGKKAQADIDAKSAHQGTDWDGLLGPPGVQ
jgi:hypothetical protein